MSSGVGLGGSNSIFTAEVSKTFDIGYANGKQYNMTSRGGEISLGIDLSLFYGIGIKIKIGFNL